MRYERVMLWPHVKSLPGNTDDVKGVFKTPITDHDVLAAFIKQLRPVTTDKKLIRMGAKGDGGYLVPDDLIGIEACFSPGVGVVSAFENDCANLGMQVFLADRSVEKPALNNDQFHFSNKFIGALSNDEFMTMDEWVNLSLPDTDGDLMLQIDIEGGEYETFLSMSQGLMNRFRVIVAEFHYLDELHCEPVFDFKSRPFQRILQTHACVHIHPNNCCYSLDINGLVTPLVMEFTFLRKDRIFESEYTTQFPHELDRKNTSKPDLVLPDCWYKYD